MTDKELLELAAKAAGIDLVSWGKPLKFAVKGSTPVQLWNPLTDDADALRLAVKLSLWVSVGSVEHILSTTEASTEQGHRAIEPHEGDPYTATRRAIVRAAAEIGKAMA